MKGSGQLARVNERSDDEVDEGADGASLPSSSTSSSSSSSSSTSAASAGASAAAAAAAAAAAEREEEAGFLRRKGGGKKSAAGTSSAGKKSTAGTSSTGKGRKTGSWNWPPHFYNNTTGIFPVYVGEFIAVGTHIASSRCAQFFNISSPSPHTCPAPVPLAALQKSAATFNTSDGAYFDNVTKHFNETYCSARGVMEKSMKSIKATIVKASQGNQRPPSGAAPAEGQRIAGFFQSMKSVVDGVREASGSRIWNNDRVQGVYSSSMLGGGEDGGASGGEDGDGGAGEGIDDDNDDNDDNDDDTEDVNFLATSPQGE
jgi:hypothetical protein